MARHFWERKEFPASSPASSHLPLSALLSLLSLVSPGPPGECPRPPSPRERKHLTPESSVMGRKRPVRRIGPMRKERRSQRELSLSPGRFPERDSGSPGDLSSSPAPALPSELPAPLIAKPGAARRESPRSRTRLGRVVLKILRTERIPTLPDAPFHPARGSPELSPLSALSWHAPRCSGVLYGPGREEIRTLLSPLGAQVRPLRGPHCAASTSHSLLSPDLMSPAGSLSFPQRASAPQLPRACFSEAPRVP